MIMIFSLGNVYLHLLISSPLLLCICLNPSIISITLSLILSLIYLPLSFMYKLRLQNHNVFTSKCYPHKISVSSFKFFFAYHLNHKNMEIVSSSKRKRLASHSNIHPDVCIPHLLTALAKSKYKHMKHNLQSGLGITFNSFPYLLEFIRNIG